MLSAALHNRLPAALAAALVVGLAVTGDATAQSGGGSMGADQTAPTPVAPPPHGATPLQDHMSGTAGGPSYDRHGTSSTDPVSHLGVPGCQRKDAPGHDDHLHR